MLPLDGLYGHPRSSPPLHAALPLLWPAPDGPGRHLSRLAPRRRSLVHRPGSYQSHFSRLGRGRLVLLVEPIWKQNSYSKRRFHITTYSMSVMAIFTLCVGSMCAAVGRRPSTDIPEPCLLPDRLPFPLRPLNGSSLAIRSVLRAPPAWAVSRTDPPLPFSYTNPTRFTPPALSLYFVLLLYLHYLLCQDHSVLPVIISTSSHPAVLSGRPVRYINSRCMCLLSCIP